MIHATSLKFGTSVNTTMAASGVLALPTGVTSIDKISAINVVASIADLTFTLPNPVGAIQQVMFINNVGGQPFTMYNRTILNGTTARFQWTGTTWQAERSKIPAFAVAPTYTLTVATLLAGSLTGTFVCSDADTITYRWFMGLTIPNVAGWKTAVRAAAPAGFTARVTKGSTYRNTGNPTGTHVAPFMASEAHFDYAGSTTTYIGSTVASGAYTTYLSIDVTYTRN